LAIYADHARASFGYRGNVRRYSGAGNIGGGDMKIREGAYYWTRNGDVIWPMRLASGNIRFCWETDDAMMEARKK
jgi:hypothetical protein